MIIKPCHCFFFSFEVMKNLARTLLIGKKITHFRKDFETRLSKKLIIKLWFMKFNSSMTKNVVLINCLFELLLMLTLVPITNSFLMYFFVSIHSYRESKYFHHIMSMIFLRSIKKCYDWILPLQNYYQMIRHWAFFFAVTVST